MQHIVLQQNKKARFEFFIDETYDCGISLLGHEVKSIKAKQCNFTDSFARVKNGALYLHNFHISPYKFYTEEPSDPARVRTLLAKKKEIEKMRRACEEKGYTLVPMEIFLHGALIKVRIGIGKGKKLHDKKESIKQHTLDREASREARDAMKHK